jgi:hypothetical protein
VHPQTYIDEPLHVSLLEVEEDGGVVEVGQIGHVLTAVVLRGVNLYTTSRFLYTYR